MQQTFADMLSAMGGDPKPQSGRDAIKNAGEIIHEVGVARMGSKASNSYCQTWDVKNLFLMDGSVLPGNPDKNPTLMLFALAWRGCEYLMDGMKKGAI